MRQATAVCPVTGGGQTCCAESETVKYRPGDRQCLSRMSSSRSTSQQRNGSFLEQRRVMAVLPPAANEGCIEPGASPKLHS